MAQNKDCSQCVNRRIFLDRGIKSAGVAVLASSPLSFFVSGCGDPRTRDPLPEKTPAPTAVSENDCSHAGTLQPNLKTDSNNVIILCLNTYTDLQNPGGSYRFKVTNSLGAQKVLSVTRIDQDHVVVVDAVCTHTGCIIGEFDKDFGVYTCPCHGSIFGADGSVKAGPATLALPIYAATLSVSGIAVTVI